MADRRGHRYGGWHEGARAHDRIGVAFLVGTGLGMAIQGVAHATSCQTLTFAPGTPIVAYVESAKRVGGWDGAAERDELEAWAARGAVRTDGRSLTWDDGSWAAF